MIWKIKKLKQVFRLLLFFNCIPRKRSLGQGYIGFSPSVSLCVPVYIHDVVHACCRKWWHRRFWKFVRFLLTICRCAPEIFILIRYTFFLLLDLIWILKMLRVWTEICISYFDLQYLESFANFYSINEESKTFHMFNKVQWFYVHVWFCLLHLN